MSILPFKAASCAPTLGSISCCAPKSGTQKRFVELDGGVTRVTGLLDTLVVADKLQADAAAVRARALSEGELPCEAVSATILVAPCSKVMQQPAALPCLQSHVQPAAVRWRRLMMAALSGVPLVMVARLHMRRLCGLQRGGNDVLLAEYLAKSPWLHEG